MGEFDIGNSVPRTEDPRLLSGGGRYVDDIDLPGLCRAHILRSPHAHAAIRGIDADAARAMPGVHAVLTGADYAASGLGTIQAQLVLKDRDGNPMVRPAFAPLAIDRAVHVGEAVAVVVADTLARARDAAEAIHVEFEPLDANIDTAIADAETTPALWQEAPRNESFVHFLGDRDAVEAGFARAAHVIERRFAISRVTSNTLEPRAFVGDVDRAGRHTLHAAVHYPHRIRSALARDIFRLPENRVRVIAGDVGGSFGLRGGMYPEQILVLWASRETGRAGQVDLRALGGADQRPPGPRQRHRRRARPRFRWQFPRHAGAHPGQYRRLRGVHGGRAGDRQSRHPRRHLCHPRHPCRDRGRVHQHQPDMPLSRRRAPGSRLCDRAAHRWRGAQARPRPGRAEAPEHDPRGRDAVPDRAGLRIRLRSVRAKSRPGARACRPCRVRAAAPGRQREGQAARHRRFQHHRARRRAGPGAGAAALRSLGHGDAVRRHHQPRPGA